MVTIRINGCTVTVPEEQERQYREVLEDRWIDGCHVYVKDQKTFIDISGKVKEEGMTPYLRCNLFIEQFAKILALEGLLEL